MTVGAYEASAWYLLLFSQSHEALACGYFVADILWVTLYRALTARNALEVVTFEPFQQPVCDVLEPRLAAMDRVRPY